MTVSCRNISVNRELLQRNQKCHVFCQKQMSFCSNFVFRGLCKEQRPCLDFKLLNEILSFGNTNIFTEIIFQCLDSTCHTAPHLHSYPWTRNNPIIYKHDHFDDPKLSTFISYLHLHLIPDTCWGEVSCPASLVIIYRESHAGPVSAESQGGQGSVSGEK